MLTIEKPTSDSLRDVEDLLKVSLYGYFKINGTLDAKTNRRNSLKL